MIKVNFVFKCYYIVLQSYAFLTIKQSFRKNFLELFKECFNIALFICFSFLANLLSRSLQYTLLKYQ